MALSNADLGEMEQHVKNFSGADELYPQRRRLTLLKSAVEEIQRLKRLEFEYNKNAPCVGCNIHDGPDETCPRHGRPVQEVWKMHLDEVEKHQRTQELVSSIANGVGRERDEALAKIEELEQIIKTRTKKSEEVEAVASNRLQEIRRLRGSMERATRGLRRTLDSTAPRVMEAIGEIDDSDPDDLFDVDDDDDVL